MMIGWSVLPSLTTFRDASAPLSPERGDKTRWLRDAATGLVTNKLYADGLGPSYTYTPDGRLATRTWARGVVTTYAYDAWGNLTNVVYSDGEEESYAYDPLGQQVAVSNSAAVVVLARDVFGRVTNETANVGGEVQSLVREFDSLGRLSEINGTSYGYDFVGRLASVSNTMAVVTYRYTSDGLDAGYTLALSNGVTFERAVVRDPQRRHLVTAITNSVNGVPVETFAYACDALGRPVSRNGDAFGYNERGEVTSATVADTPALYGYDGIGNSTNWPANSLNQYAPFGYDADGNMTQCEGWEYAYDSANQLSAVSSNGALLVANEYDAKSRRVRRVTPTATHAYFYDDWNLVKERTAYTNGATSTIHYIWGKDLSGTMQGAGGVGGLLYLVRDGAIYMPCYDNNGNITRYLDSSGDTVASYAYDAFGNTIAQSGPLADAFKYRFSTKYYGDETSLNYYGYRFYHPAIMRWLNRDPIEEDGGANIYLFCHNMATRIIDVTGRNWLIKREGDTFATATTLDEDESFESLAKVLRLDLSDYNVWAHTFDTEPVRCKKYKIPNLIVYDRGKRKWVDYSPLNIIAVWRTQNESHSDDEIEKGFKVVTSDNVSADHIDSSLKTDGLFRYTYTGHGDGAGGINTYPDESEIVIPDARFTVYGINLLHLQACGSAALDPHHKNKRKGMLWRNNWQSNVATAGFFVGYEGNVNLLTEVFEWRSVHGTNN